MKLVKRLMLLCAVSTIFGCSDNVGGGATATVPASPYQIVIDCGGSGSRVYLYEKLSTESGLVVNSLYESKINVPLASFATHPSEAGSKGIEPLLNSVISFINSAKLEVNLATIPTNILGTAGMRLVPESIQTTIYQNIANVVDISGLNFKDAKTITGQYEGVYSWVDVNYLENNFRNLSDTNGIVEVGSTSMQLAFATPQSISESVILVAINNKNYNVYSNSFLGLGQDAARKTMIGLDKRDFCYPKGYIDANINGDFNFSSCTNNYESVALSYTALEQIKNINGFAEESFIGLASVYYALNFWHIESQPSLLEENVNNTCIESFAELQSQYPNAFKLENQCANSIFINSILFDNIAMTPGKLNAVNAINNISLTWTLGYALIN